MNEMNMENFKAIISMREQFSQNREKNKLGFVNHCFDRREDLMEKNFGFKKEFLGIEDKFHKNRHHRRLVEIKALRGR